MSARWLLALSVALAPTLLSAAQAVFSSDGKRVWTIGAGEGQVAYFDVGDREKTSAADRVLDVVKAGGPRHFNGIAISKKGHLLLAAPDAVWALDTAAAKAVRVASLPAKFAASDLAYQESTGATLVWGWFVKEDRTVDRFRRLPHWQGRVRAEARVCRGRGFISNGGVRFRGARLLRRGTRSLGRRSRRDRASGRGRV